ncbi:MAG: hypothetical protein JWM31_3061 [Solirubrobacterales bacterium]|nr:hypothetical protein [Solirubrobacterales bacterium]
MNVKSTGWIRVGSVATVCALAGAGAGIAGSSAATSGKSTTTKKTTRSAPPAGRPGFGHRGGPAVHEEAVVLDEAGKAFITVTRDNGIVKSVAGNDLVITEGTKTVTYKDLTVTIPAGASITRNGKKATLADLKAGDHVFVNASSDGTDVFAADDTFRPVGPGRGFGPGHDEHEHGPGGPVGPPPAGAPAPLPGAPGTGTP